MRLKPTTCLVLAAIGCAEAPQPIDSGGDPPSDPIAQECVQTFSDRMGEQLGNMAAILKINPRTEWVESSLTIEVQPYSNPNGWIDGWSFVLQKGSHYQFGQVDNPNKMTDLGEASPVAFELIQEADEEAIRLYSFVVEENDPCQNWTSFRECRNLDNSQCAEAQSILSLNL